MFWLIFIVALWGVVHSLLASLGFKNFLRRTLGNGFMKFYRLLYNIFALVSFVPVPYLMLSLPDLTLYQVPLPWSYFLRVGQGISVILLFGAVLQTDILSFVGLRQLSEDARGDLVTSGLYRFVRHPLYTFGLLILWLSPSLTIKSLIVYAALTIYVLVGIIFEESKLLHEFGKEYSDYKSITPMLIPSLSKIRRHGDAAPGGAGKFSGNK